MADLIENYQPFAGSFFHKKAQQRYLDNLDLEQDPETNSYFYLSYDHEVKIPTMADDTKFTEIIQQEITRFFSDHQIYKRLFSAGINHTNFYILPVQKNRDIDFYGRFCYLCLELRIYFKFKQDYLTAKLVLANDKNDI